MSLFIDQFRSYQEINQSRKRLLENDEIDDPSKKIRSDPVNTPEIDFENLDSFLENSAETSKSTNFNVTEQTEISEIFIDYTTPEMAPTGIPQLYDKIRYEKNGIISTVFLNTKYSYSFLEDEVLKTINVENSTENFEGNFKENSNSNEKVEPLENILNSDFNKLIDNYINQYEDQKISSNVTNYHNPVF